MTKCALGETMLVARMGTATLSPQARTQPTLLHRGPDTKHPE